MERVKKVISRCRTDITYRAKLSLYRSLSFNIVYAIIKLTAGIHYASFWYGADALYYIVLSVIRFSLLRHFRNSERDLIKGFRRYRLCGYMLLALNIALIGVVFQIVNQGMGYEYPGLLIYAVATYTFSCIAISVIKVIKYKKYHNPVLSAQKAISLAKALVALFALQTAMFASFNENMMLERIMNTVFGSCVCFALFCMAVFMIIKGGRGIDQYSCGGGRCKAESNRLYLPE